MLLFITIFLGVFATFFFILSVVLAFYLYKFAKIIMVFEDDLSSNIEQLLRCEEIMVEVINHKIFYDSPEIKTMYQKLIDQIKICRFEIIKSAERFIERSKQKYVFYDERPTDQMGFDNSDMIDDLDMVSLRTSLRNNRQR